MTYLRAKLNKWQDRKFEIFAQRLDTWASKDKYSSNSISNNLKFFSWPSLQIPSILYISLWSTVKSSNFVTLLGENIFFRWTFWRKTHDRGRGLGIVQSHFGLGHCLGLENSFFCRVTLRSFQSYNDDFQQRMLMWSLFLWWENSLNTYDSNDTLHGFQGWVQWRIEEKLHKICKFNNCFFKNGLQATIYRSWNNICQQEYTF